MFVLSLMLTIVSVCVVTLLEAPVVVPRIDGEQTASIPPIWRRVWGFAAGILSLLTWVLPEWPVFIAAMAGHLGAMVCRNAKIAWDAKRLHITGMFGLTWDYEYAQVRYLPGRLPILLLGRSIYLLWPGMALRDTFLQEALEHVRMAAVQQDRQRGCKDTRQNAASRKTLLGNIGLALLIGVIAAHYAWPITANSGEIRQMLLLDADRYGDHQISLHFEKSGKDLIPLNDRTAPLLEDSAYGKTYTVQRQYRTSGGARHNDYHAILAMTGEDGTIYRTWQESSAVRDRNRPYTLSYAVILWFCLRRTCTGKRRRKS